MTRGEAVAACLGAGALLLAWTQVRRYERTFTQAEIVLEADGCRIPATRVEPPGAPDTHGARAPLGAYLVLHGLAANRKLMMPVGVSLAEPGFPAYVVDLPGNGDNAEPFTFSRAERCAVAAARAVLQREGIGEKQLVLVGHSLGGAIAVRLSESFPDAGATVALSPAPEVLPPWFPRAFLTYPPAARVPGNLLILVAQLDLPFSQRSAAGIVERASRAGQPHGDGDARLVIVPRSSHTSVMFEHPAWLQIQSWLRRVQPGVSASAAAPNLAHVWIGLLGLVLVSPLVAGALAALLRCAPENHARVTAAQKRKRNWLRWSAAGFTAAVVLWLVSFILPAWLSNRTYFPLFLMVTGTLLWSETKLTTGAGPTTRSQLAASAPWRDILLGVAFALFVVLAFGWWLDRTIYDAWLNAPRWLRFAPLAAAAIPAALAEELMLEAPTRAGDPARWTTELRRHFNYFARRLLLWGAMLAGIFALGSGQILLLLAGVYMTAFTIGQRLAVDAVWRRTNSLAAAVAASAILAAWFLALFPLT